MKYKKEYQGNNSIMVKNGVSMPISNFINISFNSNSKSIILKDVLQNLNIKKNLLSVAKFTHENNGMFEFTSNGFTVKDLEK